MDKISTLLLSSSLGLQALAEVIDPRQLEDMVFYSLLADDRHDSGVYMIEMVPESPITQEERRRMFAIDPPLPFYRQIEHYSSGRRSNVLRASQGMPRAQLARKER